MLVTLTTDFGLADAYVGVIKGVILGINPGANLVDISHNVAPQDVRGGAFLMHVSYRFFPPGTIHVAVVDPGVGTIRRPIALATPEATFVAPDNGLLSYVLADLLSPPDSAPTGYQPQETTLPAGVRAVHLNNPRFWRQPVSNAFHGRDIFAPAAAHLSLGAPLEELGEAISSLMTFPIPRPQKQPDGSLLGHIQHIDSFGNLISDVKNEDMRLVGTGTEIGTGTGTGTEIEIEIRGQMIKGLSRSYADGKNFVAIIGSSGYLEIALKNGNAARKLGARVGESFTICRLTF